MGFSIRWGEREGKGREGDGEGEERRGRGERNIYQMLGDVPICSSNDTTSGPAAAIGFYHLIKFTVIHCNFLSPICFLHRPNRQAE